MKTSELIKYSLYGLTIIPCVEKRPIIKNWVDGDFDINDLISRYPDADWGLRTGDKIIVIDIDVEDEFLKSLIKKILNDYYTPVQRLGNPKRLPSLFYLSSGEVPSELKIGGIIEFLGKGRHCMIPPSKHPLGGHYEWVRGENYLSLLDALERDVLPTFNMEMWDRLKILINECKKDECLKASLNKGRNNTLKEAFIAKIIKDEKSFERAVLEIHDLDLALYKDHENGPLFYDKKDTLKGKGLESAYKFANNIFKSLERAGLLKGLNNENLEKNIQSLNKEPIEEIEILTSEDENEIEKKKELPPYPIPDGIFGLAFQDILKNSPIPREELAMGGAIALMSVLFGNRYSLRGNFTNTYSLLICPSAGGKDFPLKYADHTLAKLGLKHLQGVRVPSGDVSTFESLSKQPNRLDTFDEVSKLFDKTNSSAYERTLSTYLELYTSAGMEYRGKPRVVQRKDDETLNVGECFSPCVTMIGALTPTHFKECFTNALVKKGFGSRFLFFYDDEQKVPQSFVDKRFSVPFLIKRVASMLYQGGPDEYFMEVENLSEGQLFDERLPSCFELITDEKTEKAINDFFHYINEIRLRFHPETAMANLVGRFSELAPKLIIMHCVSRSLTLRASRGGRIISFIPAVDLRDIDWAKNFLDAYLLRLDRIVNELEDQNKGESLRLQLIEFIKGKGMQGATFREIKRRRPIYEQYGESKVLIELQRLESDKIIYKTDIKTKGPSKICYFYNNNL